jgi:AsmA protein
MKKAFITALVLILLGGGVVFALPKLLPLANLQQMVKDKVHAATGRELSFSDAQLVIFPDVAVQLKNAALSNAPWAKDKFMLEVGTLDVMLALRPLFGRRVEIKSFNLKSPVVHLEKNVDGKGNWQFAPVEKVAAAPAAVSSNGAGSAFKFQMGSVKISDGRFSFFDRAKNTQQQVDKVNLAVVFPGMDSPLHLDGDLEYRQKRINLVVDLEKPAALLAGKTSPGSMDIKTDDMTAKVNGNFSEQGVLVKGDVDAQVSSLSALAAWLGADSRKLPFEKASFKSKAEVTTSQLALKDAVLSLDEVEAKGDMMLGFSGKLDLRARLALGKLALDRFTGGGALSSSGESSVPAAAEQREGWDTTPIDFNGLKSVDADLVLNTQGFSLKGMDAGPSTLTVLLKDGALHFSSSDASLSGGKFSSGLTVDAAQAPPGMTFKFAMSGVQAKPVLETFAHFKKLSGTAESTVSVASRGVSQKDIIGNLSGNGSAVFRNGSLEGIDLLNIAKLVQNRLGEMGVGTGKTDFVEMGGTFSLDKGVAINKDLTVKGPLVQATGAGSVDLPQEYVQYRITPVLAASATVSGAKGISVPLDIRGPFSKIRIKPDYQSVIQHAIENPAELKDTIKGIRQQVSPLLKDLKKDPAAALQGLFGGSLPGLAPPPANQPAEGKP